MNATHPDEATGPVDLTGLRVAIVHFWFVRPGGAERVVDVMAQMFPEADVFTLFMDPGCLPASIRSRKVTTSFLQRIPGITRHYPKFLPLFPLALEQFKLDDYDLVMSSEAGPAKGVLTRSHTFHLCYCHTPMRYVWEMFHEYRADAPGWGLGRGVYSLAAHYVRQWDFAAAARVDCFVASSLNGARRIRKYYRREAEVVYPPVETSHFSCRSRPDDFYLVVSRLVPYKRVDLAIEACNALGRRLLVIGDGPEFRALQRLAGPTVTLLGREPDEVVGDHYGRCRAFLFPGEEDIGLTPIEVQASGRPVIAFGRGGALETVRGVFPGEAPQPGFSTGIFFGEQSVPSLENAIQYFESVETSLLPAACCAQAKQFDVARFRTGMTNLVAEKLAEFRNQPATRTRAPVSQVPET